MQPRGPGSPSGPASFYRLLDEKRSPLRGILGAVPTLVSLICLVLLLCAAPEQARAVEYGLRVANLMNDGFAYFIRGSIGRGEGELSLPQLDRALDAGEVSPGALLYDRDIYPAGEGVAKSFGAVAVRPTAYSSREERALWKSVRWEGQPGERVVWVVRAAGMFWRRVVHLGLGGTSPALRYYIPYGVTLSPTPSPAVAYSLMFLRSGENGAPLWERFLSRGAEPRGGLAAVVGVNSLGTDWVYLVVEQPPEPTTFRTAVGWARRGVSDRIEAGVGGSGRNK